MPYPRPARPTSTTDETEVTRLFCTECGMRNSADSKYCKECGHKVNEGYRTMMLSVEDLQTIQDEQSQERLTKMLDMAFWHNQAGNTDAAVLACNAALKIHPKCTTAHSLLGSLYEKKGDDAQAVEHFEAVVRLNPDSAADAAKLDQVRRGVHVKAVEPPPGYKWLPPALVGLDWGRWKPDLSGLGLPAAGRPAWPERLPKPTPLVAAGAVTALFLAAGLMIVRPTRPVGAVNRHTVAAAAPVQTASAVGASAYGGALGVAAPTSGLTPPVVLKAGPHSASQAFIPVVPDPFSETLKPGVKTTPLVLPKRVARPVRTALLGHGVGTALTLPPLTLRAVPMGRSAGLAPAPVSVPAAESLPPVPQHTVVVPSLAAYPPAQAAVTPAPSDSGYGAAPSSLSSHIHISINNSPSDNSISISDRPDARTTPRRTETADGDSYQQAALSLQQQGDFRHARAAYQKAISAYKTQIASGHDADAANQGLAASQTGLQICEQSRQ